MIIGHYPSMQNLDLPAGYWLEINADTLVLRRPDGSRMGAEGELAMGLTALQQYRHYLHFINEEAKNMPKNEYADLLDPSEALDLLTIRDELSQAELSTDEQRELDLLDDLLVKHYRLIAHNIPVTDEPRSPWWWHLHEGPPTVRERASYSTAGGEEGKDISEIRRTGAEFEIYKDMDNPQDFRWRLRAANGEIIADSGEGYNDKDDCEHGIDLVKQQAPTATVQDLT
jgi:uncharacterized protein